MRIRVAAPSTFTSTLLGVLALTGCPDDAPSTVGDDSETAGDESTSSAMPSTTTVADSSSSSGEESEESGPPGVCGDGTVDAAEDCDDGEETATCNADCTAATCGDGQVNAAAGEECDDEGESM